MTAYERQLLETEYDDGETAGLEQEDSEMLTAVRGESRNHEILSNPHR